VPEILLNSTVRASLGLVGRLPIDAAFSSAKATTLAKGVLAALTISGLTGHALPSWPIVFWYVPSVGLYSTATTPCRALGVRLPSKARSVLPSWDNENRHRKLGAIRRMDQVDRRKLTLTATTPGT
jgi:hypothetical protein